jgi:DNA adenine methylase
MKPAFTRQGNKLPMVDVIIPLIPHHTLYVEPFVGSGAIFFNIPTQNAVLNDLDKELINAYKLIKKVNTNKLLSYEFNTDKSINNFYFNKKMSTPEDKLLYYRIKTSGGFSGNPVINKIYKYINPLIITKNIQFYKDKLKSADLLSEDYKKVIHNYDNKNTFFFLDPPYENTSKSFGYAEGSDTFDFELLKKTVDKIKGFFMMTINDSPYIRKLFKDYIIKKINVRNAGFNGKTNLNRTRKELIIMNYDLD